MIPGRFEASQSAGRMVVGLDHVASSLTGEIAAS